jgi:hypothetical protein
VDRRHRRDARGDAELVSSGIGLPATFLTSGVLLLAGAASVRRWPLLDAGTTGRDAVSYWPDPEITPTPGDTDAPVLVSLRYRVPEENLDAFRTAMADLRNTRLRTGGTGWAVYRDARDDTAFVEQYTVASWEEHRQQHELRLTGLDRQVQERVERLADRVDDVAQLFRVPVRRLR